MTTANINTDMLTWARERSGISVPDFARRCGISEERLREWESGERKLTFNQAMRFAEKAHVPFGYLFLAKPPEEVLPIPDLRTLEGQGVQRPSAELLDLVKLMMQRQEWYREYLQQHFAEANPYVGRASYSDSVESIVEDIRACLGVEPHPTRGKWDDYYRDLVQRIESLGILVMRQGNLGHHSRPLNVDEFRGFAIVDEYAPIIFVNHSDALGARLFTLIHELCHIWIGQSGISDGNTNTHRQEEVLCNAVAAEFLVPAQEFRALWQHDSESWEDNLPPLEAHFHVSTWALARRALTLNFISQQEYGRYIFEQKMRHEQRKGSGGPTYYQTKKAQISRQFSQAVVGEALSGQLLLREAGELLGGIKPGKIETFARELGV
ncbi:MULTISPECIES: helix-turn-helix domain-containing protein [Marinobacter]|jgi:Zn-dependent peptidase ImmA (M78 family)|uniref:DNA-binding protein n=1 Tax=Marinobacter nauticus TaxID=2743 RepID=A0A833JTC3_MARNT|nr:MULTISPECIES: ImmA/IrrE family metallo-endopeptidase [Marinobacter]MCS5575002.1 ImmA/IrrE family metallo-endopeptidase [Pseudomonadales bacterium]MEC8823781.1 ImmA/IrrE family metallo-endopeptidase [Pseudomonadota bacterium]KAE8547291.1 DNA-binding protein [Marinobacter nauticus]MAC23967.1 peptidase [Marinobacter sp.]MAC24531.1 peptidase [Marinobacter sp.]|tara:strand:+ start:1671 stop:2810 length:1140 start_codon:yes stop_codon:yes gene_type:complete